MLAGILNSSARLLSSLCHLYAAHVRPRTEVPLFGMQGGSEDNQGSAVKRWQQRLTGYIYEAVGKLRIAELFDIVKDFPETLPAVQDLGECLKFCRLHRELVRVFRASCAARLHIPGTVPIESQAILDSSHGPVRRP